jgi:tetratricopeptide (TPR) repeat protein
MDDALNSLAPERFYERGLQQDEAGSPEAAIASYSKAIDLKPDYYEAWTRRGLAWMLLRQFQPAIGNFNQAVALKPEFDLAWYLKAYCHVQIGADDIALLALQKAISLNPQQWMPMANQEPVFDRLRTNPKFQELIVSE